MNHCQFTLTAVQIGRGGTTSEDQAQWAFVSLISLALQTALLTADNCQRNDRDRCVPLGCCPETCPGEER